MSGGRIEDGPCGRMPTFDIDELREEAAARRPSRRKLKKRIKKLEEELQAIKQRTYVQVTFSQQGHGMSATAMAQSFAFRRGESIRVQLTRMYLVDNRPVWDVVPVEVTVQ